MSRGKKLYREYDEDGNLIKKECSKCGEIKTVDCFHKNNQTIDGFRCFCKNCTNKSNRQSYENNKDKRVEYSKQYRTKNKDKIVEWVKQWRENNKDKVKEYRHQLYINNKSKVAEQSKQYYKNNKDKRNDYQKQYRENNKDKIADYRKHYLEKNRDKIHEKQKQWYINHRDEKLEQNKQYNENHKDKINAKSKQWYEDKINKEIQRIYENITKKLYPHSGIQYGVIYGVHCLPSNRWYIGQTTNSFKIRYRGNFFNHKFIELSDDNTKSQLLNDDIEKYGEESFEIFEVLDVAFSEKELDEKEAYYIAYYKAYDKGYNSNRGNIFKHNKSKRKEVV